MLRAGIRVQKTTNDVNFESPPITPSQGNTKIKNNQQKQIKSTLGRTPCLWAKKMGNGLPFFFGQKRVNLKTIAAESAVSHILLANTHFLPFLAKSDGVFPIIATLFSFHPFLAILCSFSVGYSTTRTDQHGLQEHLTAKLRPGDVEIDKPTIPSVWVTRAHRYRDCHLVEGVLWYIYI